VSIEVHDAKSGLCPCPNRCKAWRYRSERSGPQESGQFGIVMSLRVLLSGQISIDENDVQARDRLVVKQPPVALDAAELNIFPRLIEELAVH
jgi:hypothetical protein